MAAKLRMGYVGCGGLAQRVHIPNIMNIEDCELVALAEIRPKLGQAVRERYRIPKLYPSHRELGADPSVQAVGVSAHYAAQGDIAADLLRAGKDVITEKPMAVSVEQAEGILAAERESGRRLMVAYMKRYDAGNLLFKRMLDDLRRTGEMGRVRYVRNHGFCGDWTAGIDTPTSHTDEPYPPAETPWPAWLPEEFRNGYLNYLQQYTHNINLLRWFLDAGGDVQVKAVDLDRAGFAGVALLRVGGCRAIIEAGSLPYHGWEESTQVYFEKGWMKTEAPPLLLKNIPASVEVYRGDQPDKALTQLFPRDGRTWSYKEEMRHFVRCVLSGEPFRSPATDAMEDVRTLENIYRMHVQTAG
jgi:predicted dehydrogenase